MIQEEDLASELQLFPSTQLILRSVDLFKDTAVVTGKLGSNIDTTILATYYWFRTQKTFKKVVAYDLNGVSVTFVGEP